MSEHRKKAIISNNSSAEGKLVFRFAYFNSILELKLIFLSIIPTSNPIFFYLSFYFFEKKPVMSTPSRKQPN
jgi:hypothetical protein